MVLRADDLDGEHAVSPLVFHGSRFRRRHPSNPGAMSTAGDTAPRLSRLTTGGPLPQCDAPVP